jgi:hypothetical protein
MSFDESVETENDDFMSENVVQQEKSKFLYLPVKFNSMQIAALIDTGSSINIMSATLYNSLPCNCKVREKHFTSAVG